MSKFQLEVKDLSAGFRNGKKFVPILDNVGFTVKKGETLCIVGESGCGKSLTSLSIMGLLPKNGEITAGEVLFENENLVHKNMKEMSKIRGNNISMIFQEPMTSLNPVHTVGKQVAEAMRIHQKIDKKDSLERAVKMFKLVGIPSPEKRVYDYPHQLSGGMRQRVMIAMALSCNPKLLIADEPTTALDVTIQAQILELMNELKKEMQMSIMMITHDLGVVSEMADNVLVMYAGKVVEKSTADELFKNPKHPYTQGLIKAIPNLKEEQEELPIIKGTVPNPDELQTGCRFADRCPFAKGHCFDESPVLIGDLNHQVSCWMYTDKWGETEEDRNAGTRAKTKTEAT
ncbi:ABC transporter ATP-binding protein [Virgibacillus siamensis]|uniref:ABC transporter ATP-binding protein n=1 Tax=Virgibacillus siamensis TaxID=480071 RepID=UPI0009869D19|nr:ABC transporter ATP-binding protein [Virgibacillus siamensis]